MSKNSVRIAALKRVAKRTDNFAGRRYIARDGEIKDVVIEAQRQLAEMGIDFETGKATS